MPRVLLLTSLLAVALPLHATVLVPAEFREIVGGSQIIVHGRVTDVRSTWTDDRVRIETIVTLEAATYMKGGPGETVTFRVPGGTIGRYRSFMVGAPEFRAGDEVVLFLKANGPSVAHVFGLSQGVFRIQTETTSGRRVVVPPAIMARSLAPQRVTRGSPDRRPVPLDAFRAQVRAALEGGGAR